MIIGISGKIGSGKGAVAEKLAEIFHSKNPVYYKIFAHPLKDIVAILIKYPLNTDKDNFFTDGIRDYSQEDKNKFIPMYNMTIGEMTQKIGTEAMRNNFDPDVWTKAIFIDYDDEKNYIWIIPDCRFPNEIDAIKSRGGIIIRVNGDPAKVNSNTKRDKTHISETALDNYKEFDYIIENNSTLEDLYAKIEEIANSIIKKNNNN